MLIYGDQSVCSPPAVPHGASMATAWIYGSPGQAKPVGSRQGLPEVVQAETLLRTFVQLIDLDSFHRYQPAGTRRLQTWRMEPRDS